MDSQDEQFNRGGGQGEGRDEIADELALAEYGAELTGQMDEERARATDEFWRRMREAPDKEERRRIWKERRAAKAKKPRTDIIGFSDMDAIALGFPELRDMYVRIESSGTSPVSSWITEYFGDHTAYIDMFDAMRTEGLMEAGVLDADGLHWHDEPQEPNPPFIDPFIEQMAKDHVSRMLGSIPVVWILEMLPPERIEELRGQPHSERLLRKYMLAFGGDVDDPDQMEQAERWLDDYFENR